NLDRQIVLCHGQEVAHQQARPPSPDIEITWRPGKAGCAPIACGNALAIDPCMKEPISRRPFVGWMYREDQTLHIPVSAVKIASSCAISFNAAATGSGCMGRCLPM